MAAMDNAPIYQLRVAEVFTTLETSPAGLTSATAAERQELFGLNLLAEDTRPSIFQQLFAHINYPIAALLLLVGVGAMILGQVFLGLAVFALVLVNSGLSFWRNHRAEQAMDALRRLLPEYTRVLRNGAEVDLPASQLVPGDILILAEGDNIPADARVIEEFGLRTNNATLTGDAIPARKTADASFQEGISELERPNLVFAGTSVVSGTGQAVVFATGMVTQFGRIAHLTQSVVEDPSPMQTELSRLLRKISWVALGIGALVLAVGFYDARVALEDWEAVFLALGIVVAAIPEGLSATLTLALAIAGQRLAQKGVLVKKLSVLETLGTISTICTDKSGTLTQNQMTVRQIWVAGRSLEVTGVGYDPTGAIGPDLSGQPPASDLQQLLTAMWCCNNSRLIPPGPGKPAWSYLGDQTEAALRVAALKGQVSEVQVANALPRVHELPFDARRKLMTTIHEATDGWKALANGSREAPGPGTPAFYPRVAFVKGAPRELLQLCTHILIDGRAQPMTNILRQQIKDANDEYARMALRVMGVARRSLGSTNRAYTPDSVEQELTFLGLVAMHDPPRPGITEAMSVLRQAGIRLVMITGDYGLTALALARRAGMLASENVQIITGAELDEMNEFELSELLHRPELLFARMAPEHKLRLVSTLQEMGEVVAVTGDGVNDAPALRKADVGISMGLTGTDVAKEAADIILTDDNFATVVDAVKEGRTLYDNLRKFLTYIFSSNVPEVLPFLLTAVTHIPLALGVEQILAIDLGTDLLPAIGLASERPEPDVMSRPPRRRSQTIVEPRLLRRAFLWLGMIESGLCYSAYFLVFYLAGRMHLISERLGGLLPPVDGWLPTDYFTALANDDVYRLAATAFYAGVVMAQVGNAFACRAEVNRSRQLGWLSNRLLLFGVGAAVLQMLLVIYLPPLQTIFDHAPLPIGMWLYILPFSLVLYGLEWIRKGIVRSINQASKRNKPVEE